MNGSIAPPPQPGGPRRPSDAARTRWRPDVVSLGKVIDDELRYVTARREATHGDERNKALLRKQDGAAADRERPPVDSNLAGLAFSGGGIRSATTCLGIAQALSRMRLMPQVDYLSTVSGGGYIGGCLSWLLSIRQGVAADPDTPEPYTFKPGDRPLFDTSGAFPLSAVYHPPGTAGADRSSTCAPTAIF